MDNGSVVPEECQEDDDRDWHPQQPKQRAASEAHGTSFVFMSGIETLHGRKSSNMERPMD
jgi:hypothetical protein